MKLKKPIVLSIVSVLLGVAGAWCVGYSVIDRFNGEEYFGVTADNDGHMHQTPAYKKWDKENTLWNRVGLILITVGGAVQIASMFVKPPDYNC